MTTNALALQRSLADIVDEYNVKLAALPEAIRTFNAAGTEYQLAGTVGGTYGRTTLDTGRACERSLAESLLKSAWHHVYDGLNIALIASAKDKKLFEQSMTRPAPFTLENIRAAFGHYIIDPRVNILRGLAETFCDLDPAYKSHDKVRIGVKGLPKRIILTNISDYGWGRDRLQNVLNALAQYNKQPLVTYGEVSELLENGNALLNARIINEKLIPARGVWLKRFANGNGHLFFTPETLTDINKALAEYYGEVLPDCSDDKPEQRRASTAVAKDLQYYPTPAAVIERVISAMNIKPRDNILEPSCGCGRFLDALEKKGAIVLGIEVDAGRANEARAKGHSVMTANFLETEPRPIFDYVIMNPPFYGKHYAKHVEHAFKFLKPGGTLKAILPITARYDHGLLSSNDRYWQDLPVGSFAESGTKINTTIYTAFA